MKERFLDLWKKIGASGDGNKIYEELEQGYKEAHRHYHAFEHICDCLNSLDSALKLAKMPDELELALWYHDSVYDTHARDSEQRSTDLAYSIYKDSNLSDDFASRIKRLILATQYNKMMYRNDYKLIADIDFVVLSKPKEAFDAYCSNIRNEYCRITDENFRKGRIAVLKSFLDRPYIYRTKFFREKYETSATSNLNHEIIRLIYA